MRVENMFKRLTIAMFGAAAIFAAVALPADAQDVPAKAVLCAACHGANGQPLDPKTMPIIWGQQSNYLFKELHDYKSGDRDNPIMAGLVKDIPLPELRQLANYFAGKSWPAANGGGAPGTLPEKAVMCLACHGQKFEGGQPAPRLAGLSYEYLIGAMNGFAHDGRTNNLDMPGFMKVLSDSEREAIARYISAL
jgi:cytochrome c553